MLQRLQIQSDIQNEKLNKMILQEIAENNSIKSTGLAIANARAKAEAELIKG